MGRLNVAVIGIGAMGKSHARVYSEMKQVNLVAVCDQNEVEEATAKKYSANYYQTTKKMFDSEKIDAVSVCVPTKYHREVSIDTISRKIPTLIEKPMAANEAEASEIIKKSEEKNIKVMIGHIERFNPVIMELKKRIEKNELGKIYKAHCQRLSPFPSRVIDVGVTIDLAIHDIDVLSYIINSGIERVYAETSHKIHSKHEDLLIGTLRFKNGVIGVINANWLTPKKVREIAITGEKGMFVADYITQELVFCENDFVNQEYNGNLMTVIAGKSKSIEIVKKEPLKNELECFIDCVSNNKEVPIKGSDGLNAIRVAQKLLESSRNNKVVKV